jgi:hypothetical protein
MTGGWQQPRVVVMCFCILSLFSLFADILRSTCSTPVAEGPDAVATVSFNSLKACLHVIASAIVDHLNSGVAYAAVACCC